VTELATVFDGTQSWTLGCEDVGFPEQFDRACKVLASFGRDGNQLNQLVLRGQKTFTETATRYFDSLPFVSLSDLFGAVSTIFLAPQELFGENFNQFLAYVPAEKQNLDDITFLLESIQEDAVEQQLQRIWRNPSAFDLTPEFIATLGSRIMSYSLPATEYQYPIQRHVVVSALHELKRDFDAAKLDVEHTVTLAAAHAQAQGLPFGRKDEKQLRKVFREGLWTQAMQELYEVQARDLRERMQHLARYAGLAGWAPLEIPEISGNR
jgi:hypothetical protein